MEFSSITVRDGGEADIAAVHHIYAQAVLEGTATFEIIPPSVAEMAGRRAAILAHPGPYLVAVGEGAVLGFAYAGSFRSRPAFNFTVENTVYVAPPALRRGVGLALTLGLIERCTAMGYRQMIAVIGGDNAASVALHARAGFVPAGVLKNVGRKFDRWLDVTLMQRELAPPDQK